MKGVAVVVFLDFAMFILLVALSNDNSQSAPRQPASTLVIQKLFSTANVGGRTIRLDEEIDIGVRFEVEGTSYTDLEQGERVFIAKNVGGLAIRIIDGDVSDGISVFARSVGESVASCLIAGSSCPKFELSYTCASPTDRHDDTLSISNDFHSRCF
jgi:hypothetical protein